MNKFNVVNRNVHWQHPQLKALDPKPNMPALANNFVLLLFLDLVMLNNLVETDRVGPVSRACQLLSTFIVPTVDKRYAYLSNCITNKVLKCTKMHIKHTLRLVEYEFQTSSRHVWSFMIKLLVIVVC